MSAAMVPLDRSSEIRYANFNRPGTQLWQVDSADGLWRFERLEDVGTPWVTYHRPSRRDVGGWAGTLKAARIQLAAALEAGRVCARCGGGDSLQVSPPPRQPCDCEKGQP